jgi:hypothetical protein
MEDEQEKQVRKFMKKAKKGDSLDLEPKKPSGGAGVISINKRVVKIK